MKITLLCKLMVALLYQNDVQVVEMDVVGKLLNESDTHYVVDFSEDIRRLPIVGTPQNYSKVKLLKDKCRKYD